MSDVDPFKLSTEKVNENLFLINHNT